MASILEFDPREAGIGAAASVLGRMSAPSRLPVGLGSILGAAAGAYGEASQKAQVQQETLTNQRMLRQVQIEGLKEKAEARRQALEKAAREQKAQEDFRNLLSQSDDPSDPINVLGAGVKTGALNAQQYSTLLSNVQEKQAARKQRIQELQLRLGDQKIAREEREAFQREMLEARNAQQKDMTRLAAALRPAPQGQVVKDEAGNYVRINPDNTTTPVMAGGKPLRGAPSGTGRLSEQEARATLFMRQMSSAEAAAKDIVGENFDLSKAGSQIGIRAAGSDWTNWAAGPKAQKYAQAAEQWAEAYLRLKTGAATNQDEIRRNARAYFPQPGDSEAVIAQKAVMRKKAIEDVSIVAGRGASAEPKGKDPWE